MHGPLFHRLDQNRDVQEKYSKFAGPPDEPLTQGLSRIILDCHVLDYIKPSVYGVNGSDCQFSKLFNEAE